MIIYRTQQLSLHLDTIVGMTPNADILSVQMQGGEVVMWYEHDPDEETVLRKFVIYPTGFEFQPFEGKYLGTVQQGGFVWHAYEVYE